MHFNLSLIDVRAAKSCSSFSGRSDLHLPPSYRLSQYMNALIIEFVDFQFVLLSCQNYNCDVLHTDTATTTCIVHMNSSITNEMRQKRAKKKHPQRRRRWDNVDGDDKIVATISHIFPISQLHIRLLHTQERGYSCDWVDCDNADQSNEKKRREEKTTR